MRSELPPARPGRRRVLAACLALGLAAIAPARAQGDGEPLRLLVPYSPGGFVDLVARKVGARIAEQTGRNVTIENRSGAMGAVAFDALRAAPADGRTLVLMDPAILINPVIKPSLPYRVPRDLRLVATLAQSPLILTVNASLPVNTEPELVAYAKAHPGVINYSSAGVGTTPHMAGEMLKAYAGIELTHIPYKGGNAAVADLLSGQVQMSFMTATIMAQFAQDGRVRALASSGAERSRRFPQLPTMRELGLKDFEVNAWIAVFAPARLDDAGTEALHRVFTAAMQTPELQKSLEASDLLPFLTSRDDGLKLMTAESRRWAEVARINQVKAD